MSQFSIGKEAKGQDLKEKWTQFSANVLENIYFPNTAKGCSCDDLGLENQPS